MKGNLLDERNMLFQRNRHLKSGGSFSFQGAINTILLY